VFVPAALLGAVVLAEPLSAREWAGVALGVASVALLAG
jgi:drug/metabolite transporter (DMT)-like permease